MIRVESRESHESGVGISSKLLTLYSRLRNMLLAIDIGNSFIKFGVFDNKNLVSRFTIPTDRSQTAGEMHQAVESEFNHAINAVIVSSVVPEIDAAISEFSLTYLGVNAVFVHSECDFGFSKINYEPVSGIGTDRLIAAFAAVQRYGKPCIVCDFGTATTIDAVNSNGEYLGGIITPGINTLAEALQLNTSKLPRVKIEKPQSVIGTTTLGSIQSGIFYGYIGLVEGILNRMIRELGETPKIIATGGFLNIIAENCESIEFVNENLILDGLQIMNQRFIKQEVC